MKSLKEALVHKHLDSKVPNPFGLTKNDLIGDLRVFPMGIVVRMLEEQEKQGNKPNIKVFQQNIASDKHMGGFNWADSRDGMDFWHDVINPSHLNSINSTHFFKKHPEYKKYNL